MSKKILAAGLVGGIVIGIILGVVLTVTLISGGLGSVDFTGPPDVILTIPMQDVRFLTEDITVNKGDNVLITLVNSDPIRHDFTIDELDIKVHLWDEGQVFNLGFTAEREGTYSFYCSIEGHRLAGMEGTITING
ncbi:MAG: cupredoxin domain-containing protein [Nitrosopumilus sp.]